ncbi:O-antigen ligase family protein [Pimelobacter simplex]|uniref:O-antigen ligase family protein n=1 Tax=Nocardioides simplex TaxID=2045 RepID=UPI003AAF5E06
MSLPTLSPLPGYRAVVLDRARPLAGGVGGRPLALAVALVIVVLPFGDTTVPGAGLSLTYVAMAVPALLVLRLLVLDRIGLPPSLVFLGLALSVAGGVVSAATGVDPDRAVPSVVISLLTLGYGLAIVVAFRPGSEVDAIDLLVVVGGVVAAMALTSVGSAGALQAAEGGSVVLGRLTGPFAQPNELGIFCAALLPLTVVALVSTGSRRRTVVLGLAAACLVGAWAMSMSRGAWIGGVVALVGLAICEPATRRALAGVGATVLAAAAAAVVLPASTPVLGVVGARLRSLGDPTQNQYDDRPLIWAEAWRQASEHPWFGVGPSGFKVAAGQTASAISAEPADHPHDLALTILADRGVVGLALGLVVVAGCVLAARRQVLAGPGPVRPGAPSRARSLAVLAALSAVAVHCVFDMPLRNPIVAGLVWTLLGMAMTVEARGAPDEGDAPRPVPNHPPTGERRPW